MSALPSRARVLRLVVPFSLALCAALPSHAQQGDVAAAENLVRQFYAEHSKRFNDGDTPLLNDAPAAKEFLVDGLVQGELQGILQFDPVYDAQDASISDLSIRPDPEAPLLQGAARIQVTFTNFGMPIRHIYTLISVPDGSWQINDIYSETNDWSLSDLLQSAGVDIRSDPGSEITLKGGSAAGSTVGSGQTQAAMAETPWYPAWRKGTFPETACPLKGATFCSFWTVQAPCGDRSTVLPRSPPRNRRLQVLSVICRLRPMSVSWPTGTAGRGIAETPRSCIRFPTSIPNV